MKEIVLSGDPNIGLYPVIKGVNKHQLPICDKSWCVVLPTL